MRRDACPRVLDTHLSRSDENDLRRGERCGHLRCFAVLERATRLSPSLRRKSAATLLHSSRSLTLMRLLHSSVLRMASSVVNVQAGGRKLPADCTVPYFGPVRAKVGGKSRRPSPRRNFVAPPLSHMWERARKTKSSRPMCCHATHGTGASPRYHPCSGARPALSGRQRLKATAWPRSGNGIRARRT